MGLVAVGSLGAQELIIILVIVLLLFGAKRLPEMARSLGKAKKEFQEGLREMEDDKDEQDKPPTPSSPTDDKPSATG